MKPYLPNDISNNSSRGQIVVGGEKSGSEWIGVWECTQHVDPLFDAGGGCEGPFRHVIRAQADEEELQILRDHCERLEEERSSGFGIDNSEIIEQLRSDMEGLMNDELMTAKDSDLTVIRDLDSQLKEYKPTSQLFLQAPKMEDQLPMGPDGGLYLSGRSSAPTRALVPMKAVVTSTTAIIDDVRAYEQRPSRADVDVDILHTLRERAEATLTNLVVAYPASRAEQEDLCLLQAPQTNTVDKSPINGALGTISDDSAPSEGGEDAWSELKPYLEAQTESIVYAIQSVLSGVRSPVPPPTLNENLTQIITIVSSIVAVCSDNLPPASASMVQNYFGS
ncbi:hypothetical protein P692DRAFT_20916055 [Suillus brevipes Sb2]|nr:hypothetical protein P692DRAFT_20916055 [Suillus brevipes Sb2]